jgi:hypothetical protein
MGPDTAAGPALDGHGVMPRRPAPEKTRAVLLAVAGGRGRVVQIPVLVAALRRETGCSRATGYRAVQDAIQAGLIQRAHPARPRNSPPAVSTPGRKDGVGG